MGDRGCLKTVSRDAAQRLAEMEPRGKEAEETQ